METGEWRLFPPPTDPKIIEIWLNLRFISSEVRLLVGNNAQPGVIVLLATGRGAPKQRLLALCNKGGYDTFSLTPMDQLPQKNCVFGGVGTHSSRAFMVVHVGVM